MIGRRSFTLAIFIGLVSACSSIPTSKPLPPAVTVESVKPLKLSLSRQKIEFKLRVKNPNDYDLPLQYLNFTATLDEKPVADGMTNERVTVPAMGEAIVEVIVNAKLNRLLSRFLLLIDSDEADVGYGVTGYVKLANWPTRIPFNVNGALENPALGK